MKKVYQKILIPITIITITILVFNLFQNTSHCATAKSKQEMLQSLVDKMQKRFDAVPAFRADFIQETYSESVQLSTTGKGKLYIQKPRSMRWDYTEPEKQSFVTDGKKTWLYIPSEKRILIDDAKHFFDSPLVKSFLDGPKNLTKYFKLEAKRGKNYPGFVLKLAPRPEEKELEIEEIRVWVEPRNYQIEAIETKDYLGNRNKVKLENIEVVEKLPDNLFTLIVPPGVTIERNVTGNLPSNN